MATHSQSQIVTNASMAATVTSKIIGLNLFYGCAVSAVYTTSGTLGGTFTLQTSEDHQEDLNGNVIKAGTFNTVQNSSVTITGAGTYTWDITATSCSYIKLVYTPAGGDTGTLNAYITIKGQ